MDSKHLGTAIKQARQAAGLTQDQLSDKAGLAYSTLAKIEQGKIGQPSVFTVAALGQVLNLPIDSLLAKPETAKGRRKPKQPEKTSFIYCDVNGVIVCNYQHAFAAIAHETGVPFDRVEHAFWRLNDAANRGELTVSAFDAAFAHHLGVDRVDWEKHYFKSVERVTEVQKLLQSLAGRYKIGLLTNTMPGFLAKLKKQELLPGISFAAVIDSSQAGMVKPEPAIFELAERKSGLPPQEILLIDDTKANLAAARKRGWQGVWFDEEHPERALEKLGALLKG